MLGTESLYCKHLRVSSTQTHTISQENSRVRAHSEEKPIQVRILCACTESHESNPNGDDDQTFTVGSKSKLQCNLVSGCWDETLPEGSQCLMASSIIQSLFGRREVYPSLFTDDPSDTKCSADVSMDG